MRDRRDVWAVGLVVVVGCSNSSVGTTDAGDARAAKDDADDAHPHVDASADADSAHDAGLSNPYDAASIQCGDAASFPLIYDDPNACEVPSPANVFCDSASDCSAPVECGCPGRVYGINRKAGLSLACDVPPPPCNGPLRCDGGFNYHLQDCTSVPSVADIGARCVHHQCLTYAKSDAQ
jgi:hypothetical protein